MEEVDEFRTVAGDAQQVVAAAEQAARERILVLPTASEIRQKVAEENTEGDEEFEIIQGLDDEQLLRIGDAVLQLVNGEQEIGEGAEGGGSNDAEPEESEEDRILLQRKIEAQQQELDGLLESFHRKQEQIIRLKDQLSGKDDVEKKKQVKEKLQNAERQAEGLTRQLETSEMGLRQSQELRTQLRALAMQAVQRDQVLAEMRSMFEMQADEVSLLRDRLLHSLEDLSARVGRRAERRQRAAAEVPEAAALPSPSEAAGGDAALGSTATPSSSLARGAAEKVTVIGSEPVETSDLAVQVELDNDGTVAAIAESVQLRMQIDDVRIEKALLEKRMAKQAEELRALVEPTRVLGRSAPQPSAAGAPAAADPAAGPAGARGDAGAGGAGGGFEVIATEKSSVRTEPEVVNQTQQYREVAYHDISSDGEGGKPKAHRRPLPDPDAEDTSDEGEQPEYSAGMLYVQQVADLEQRNDALRDELDLLHEAERGLRAKIKEKNDLIANLMQKAKLPPPSSAPHGQERGFWRSRQGRRNDSDGEFRDLERTIEETQEDNVRLRNDIQVMADEFRKVLSSTAASEPKKA